MTNGLVCPPGSGCVFPGLTALGLPHVLLWVLTFAISYAVLKKTPLGNRSGALIAIVLGFLVLMAVPATLITFIAGMSTGFVVLAIGAIVLLSVLVASGTGGIYETHGSTIGWILLLVVVAMFVGLGGLGLIGITAIPVITPAMWVLILVGVAILWMVSEKPPQPQKKE